MCMYDDAASEKVLMEIIFFLSTRIALTTYCYFELEKVSKLLRKIVLISRTKVWEA